MPDQLAHFIFAQKVWSCLGGLRSRINPVSAAFRAGSFGPDPLFNDLNPARRSQGFAVHRGSGMAALESFRPALRENLPGATDYAAGFFTHYALDRLCHPFLKALDAGGEVRHVPMEAAYDRMLYLRGGYVLPRHISLSREVCRTAVLPYDGVSGPQFRRDVDAYWKLRRMLLLAGGTGLSHIPDKINPAWRGIIPDRKPSSAVLDAARQLDVLMLRAIPVAAEQLRLYFRAIDMDLPLDCWTNADFSGA